MNISSVTRFVLCAPSDQFICTYCFPVWRFTTPTALLLLHCFVLFFYFDKSTSAAVKASADTLYADHLLLDVNATVSEGDTQISTWYLFP